MWTTPHIHVMSIDQLVDSWRLTCFMRTLCFATDFIHTQMWHHKQFAVLPLGALQAVCHTHTASCKSNSSLTRQDRSIEDRAQKWIGAAAACSIVTQPTMDYDTLVRGQKTIAPGTSCVLSLFYSTTFLCFCWVSSKTTTCEITRSLRVPKNPVHWLLIYS